MVNSINATEEQIQQAALLEKASKVKDLVKKHEKVVTTLLSLKDKNSYFRIEGIPNSTALTLEMTDLSKEAIIKIYIEQQEKIEAELLSLLK